ncbi:MAG: hypothetical protein J4478_01990 [Candidatus Diapherotrites archaeon]|uniref:Uncharacterized protein n=1 Tax=Candidatus Iainarchaeum sp. TaxID=3101447 RepID=A0A7J4JYE9_9ARCH|nr:hypothetical protein [Candidatus Diapherotrites archaeon]HIH21699.1 hypothetical protein [Candidatus Diapherotrites archaeon]
MASTIEYLALGIVAIVLVVSLVQAVQLNGLGEKVSQQNAALTTLATGGSIASLGTASAASVPQQTAAPSSSAMVGGC